MWADGYQFPDSTEFWDANWVRCRIVCVGQQATVKLAASCVHLPEFETWLDACKKLDSGDVDLAALDTMEPYLRIKVDRSGDFRTLLATVMLTPDNVTQFHEFRYPIDPSYLKGLITALGVVLKRLPVRGVP